MEPAIRIFLKREFENIKKKWKQNPLIYKLLEEWFMRISFVYKAENNFLYHTPPMDYIEQYLKLIDSLEKLEVYSIEDVINDKNNSFYKHIEKIPANYVENILFRLKKQDEKFIVDDLHGDYFLNVFGRVCEKDSVIELMINNNIITDFHHELTHLILSNFKYAYPDYFPFSDSMNKTFYEGDAVYHENMLCSSFIIESLEWNDITIKTRSYELYYQLYSMLILSLPVSFVKNWKIGVFDVTLFSLEQKKCYAQLFAILTILSAKADNYNNLEDFMNEIKLYYSASVYEREETIKYCAAEEKKTEEAIYNYQDQIDELTLILNDSTLLKEKYNEYLQNDNKMAFLFCENQDSLESFINSLNRIMEFLIVDKQEEEINRKDVFVFKNYKLQEIDFGLSLVDFLQEYMKEKLSVQELYQMFVEKVVFILEERKEHYAFVDFIVTKLEDKNRWTR